jgi:hypothetical protein
MALNFNLLNPDLPGQIATSFTRGYEGAQDRANLLAQRQQQNQLNALQLQEAQQQQQQRNALSRGYSEAYNPQTGAIDYNKLRQSLAAGGMGSQIPGVEKQQLEQQQTEAGLFSSKMDMFRNAWSNVRTLDDALAIHEKTHSDPIVGRMLESMGITKEQGTQRLIEAAKNPETWTNYIRQAINGADAFKQQVVGGSIYDFATGQFRTPPKEQQQPSGVQEFLFAKSPEGGGYRGSYQQFIADKAAAGRAPGTTIINTQEKAEKSEFGKFLVKDYENISKRAEVAQKSISAIDANLNILNKGFETGFGTETKAAAAKVLSALGVEKANMFATNAQIFEAKAAESILETLRQQVGPQTDADAKRVTLTGAQLANTTQANKFLLDVAKVVNKREIEQRNFYNNWRKNTGSFDGAEEAWIAGKGGKSLFDRPELKKYAVGTNAAAQIPTVSAPVAAPAARAIPPAAVQMLLSGQGTDAQFDAIFGAGAAKRVRGGR